MHSGDRASYRVRCSGRESRRRLVGLDFSVVPDYRPPKYRVASSGRIDNVFPRNGTFLAHGLISVESCKYTDLQIIFVFSRFAKDGMTYAPKFDKKYWNRNIEGK